MFVFDQLLVFMRHDPLLDLELRTIRRDLRPVISSLADIDTQLQKVNLRPFSRYLDRVKMLHLRRAEEVPYAITQLFSPFLRFHYTFSCLTSLFSANQH